METLTRVSQKVRSQLDPGHLDPLGEGSFGQVFRAEKDRRPVAVKILKDIADRKQVQDFEREVDMLRLETSLLTLNNSLLRFSCRGKYWVYRQIFNQIGNVKLRHCFRSVFLDK